MIAVLAQFAAPVGLGQVLIWLIVLAALWGIFLVAVAPKLPPTFVTVANIVLGAIAAIIAVRVLLSFV
jgi:hypothetical protein